MSISGQIGVMHRIVDIPLDAGIYSGSTGGSPSAAYVGVLGSVLFFAAANSTVWWDIALSSGTYSVSLVHIKDPGFGSACRVQFDNQDVGATVNLNAGSQTYNNFTTVSGIVVASTGVHRVGFRSDASGAYGLQKYVIQRSS